MARVARNPITADSAAKTPLRWPWHPSDWHALIALLAVGLLLATPLLAATAPAAGPPTPAQIAAWVRDLGHDQFATREAAEKALVAAGDAALDAVKAVAGSPDAEVRQRAERILSTLDRHRAQRDLTGPARAWRAEAVWSRPDLAGLSTGAIGEGVLLLPTSDGQLTCLEQATGKTRWAVGYERPVAANAPVVGPHGAYVQPKARGPVQALALASGRPRWEAEKVGAVSLRYAHAIGPHLYLPDNQGTVQALDAATGKPAWSYTAPQPRPVRLCASGDALYLNAFSTGLVALEATTGKVRWQANIPTTSQRPSVVREGTWYVGVADGVLAVNAADGKQTWDFTATAIPDLAAPRMLGVASGELAADERHVYYSAYPGLIAVRRADGKLAWRLRLTPPAPRVRRDSPAAPDTASVAFTSLTPAGQWLLAGSPLGLHAVDAATGKEAWRLPTVGVPQVFRAGDLVLVAASAPQARVTATPAEEVGLEKGVFAVRVGR